jgi:uncharacterized protein YbjT (DUF2867 family)
MIAITGATGHTGSLLATQLLRQGEKVRAIGRSEERLRAFKNKGAEIAVGDQTDQAFLTRAFSGADAVYLLLPPKSDDPDFRGYQSKLTATAVGALKDARVGKVVLLSSFGAELESGTGPVMGLHEAEQQIGNIAHLDAVFIRAGSFMENTLMRLSMIKVQGIMGSPAAPDRKVSLVATRDIAAYAAAVLSARNFTGHAAHDLYGDQLTYNEITAVLSKKLALPGLKYVQFPAEQAVAAMVGMGMSKSMADAMVELEVSVGQGKLHTTNVPDGAPNAPTRFAQFVDEVFAPAYRAQK